MRNEILLGGLFPASGARKRWIETKAIEGGLVGKALFLICLTVFSFGVTLGLSRVADDGEAKQLQPGGSPVMTPVVKTVLSNGLTLLVKPTNANEVVALNLLVRCGSLYETPGQRGISSLTQQVLIHGSRTRNAREIALATEAAGAEIDAGLGSGYGYLRLLTTTGGWEAGLDILLELLRQPGFTETELAKEKKMLIESMTAREDQPLDAAYLTFMETFYAGQPNGVKTADLIASVARLTRKDLTRWYQKVYVPQNMVISIVGKVDPATIRRRLEAALGKAAAGKLPSVTMTTLQNQTDDKLGFKRRATRSLFLVLGYPAPQLTDKESLAMEVINQILGGGSEGRLYAELRERRGLVYTVSTGYEKLNGQAHIYTVMATTPHNYQAARDQVVREFRCLAAQPVTARELAMVKQVIRGGYLRGHETNEAQSLILGRYELNGLGYAYDQKYPQLIGRVTAAEVQQVAARYFKHYTMGVIAGEALPE